MNSSNKVSQILSLLMSAKTCFTIAGYIAFTLVVTEWKTKYRRSMNDTDNKASNTALDSLLNYEVYWNFLRIFFILIKNYYLFLNSKKKIVEKS